MPRYLIIDGYNAINKIRMLESERGSSLEAARALFVKMLKNFMSTKKIFDRIYVVFDSKEREIDIKRYSYGDIHVLFATENKDADRVIVDILRRASPSDRITVSSDDNFVRNHAKGFGRDVVSIAALEEIIMLKKKGGESKINEKGLSRDSIKYINAELERHWGLIGNEKK